MSEKKIEKFWSRFGMTRREFLRYFGIASSAITMSPFFMDRWTKAFAAVTTVKVYLVKNGDSFQNTAKIWAMLGGPSAYIQPTDTVVIKGNCQSANQGYTHTGCIKGVIDKILEIPGFSGEIFICDNTQESAGKFDVSPGGRVHNWLDHNWNSLAAEYQGLGKPVATKQWYSTTNTINGPQDGEGWIRDYFSFYGRDSYLSYPIFESPITSGRFIDMANGIWENGSYLTGSNVKPIFMPNLNNHGFGADDYAGLTSAIKSFFGATEIHNGAGGSFNGFLNIHNTSFRGTTSYAGEIVARFIQSMYSPALYITAAMWSGHYSRTGAATETKTVLACENPATLDYVSSKYVISPYASYLDPDLDNSTRKQILACIAGGIGTINPAEFEIISYDFLNPTVNRLDIDRKIRDYKAGIATESEVRLLINQYMETS